MKIYKHTQKWKIQEIYSLMPSLVPQLQPTLFPYTQSYFFQDPQSPLFLCRSISRQIPDITSFDPLYLVIHLTKEKLKAFHFFAKWQM